MWTNEAIYKPQVLLLHSYQKLQVRMNHVFKTRVFLVYSNQKMQARINTLRKWHQSGGVLMVGHDLFAAMASAASAFAGAAAGGVEDSADEDADTAVADTDKALDELKGYAHYHDELMRLLVNPGADIVVMDEGHVLRNDTHRARAFAQVRTARRLCLTGTPLQNNLMEYYTSMYTHAHAHTHTHVHTCMFGRECLARTYSGELCAAGATGRVEGV
jgi:hypothetical protein